MATSVAMLNGLSKSDESEELTYISGQGWCVLDISAVSGRWLNIIKGMKVQSAITSARVQTLVYVQFLNVDLRRKITVRRWKLSRLLLCSSRILLFFNNWSESFKNCLISYFSELYNTSFVPVSFNRDLKTNFC